MQRYPGFLARLEQEVSGPWAQPGPAGPLVHGRFGDPVRELGHLGAGEVEYFSQVAHLALGEPAEEHHRGAFHESPRGGGQMWFGELEVVHGVGHHHLGHHPATVQTGDGVDEVHHVRRGAQDPPQLVHHEQIGLPSPSLVGRQIGFCADGG
ncbi:hypothetical protein ACFFX0_32680 [Citricoccus parietis]|uniref:Uncharacterized protein n=1 Tax=Citricoccus parietis TaxID=592307 RepID=A0ABV5G9Q8_9MICC